VGYLPLAEVSLAVRTVISETAALASRFGSSCPSRSADGGRGEVGAHKTSRLVDLEAGCPMETEAGVGAVVELGGRLGVAMPATQAVYACTQMLNEKQQGQGVG
jgi:2-dehydropantoate 2-reductase